MNKFQIKGLSRTIITAVIIALITIMNSNLLNAASASESNSTENSNEPVGVKTVTEDGVIIINSTSLAKDVVGYDGYTPVELHIKDNIIEKVVFLENTETPRYFKRLTDAEFAQRWVGMSPEEALVAEVDVISRATLSSEAIVKNVQRAAQFYIENEQKNSAGFLSKTTLYIALALGLLVIIGVYFAKSRKKAA